MKKILLLIFIIVQGLIYAEEETNTIKLETTSISEENITEETSKKVEGMNRFNFGIDVSGAFSDSDNNKETNAAPGFIFTLERAYRVSPSIEYSFGVSYQGNDKIKTTTGDIDNFYSIPVYIGVKYNIFEQALYIRTKLGFLVDHNNEKIENYLYSKAEDSSIDVKYKYGYYFSLGVGYDYGDWEMDISYNLTDLEYKTDISESLTVENIRVSMGISKFIN
jgi:hypothetical protein